MNRTTLGSLFTIFLFLIIWASFKGNFFEESTKILNLNWGLVMLFDLYLGLFIFVGFIFWIEKSLKTTLCWAIAMIVGGNLVSLLYLMVKYKIVSQLFSRSTK